MLALTLNGCASKGSVVNYDSFCDGKYTSMRMTKQEFDTIDRIRKYPTFKPVVDKFIHYWAMNERELDYCSAK